MCGIIFFSFYWFFSSARRYSEKRKISNDPAYPLRKEIARANRYHKRKDIKNAIASYDRIRDIYSKVPVEIKAMMRPEIISLHERIVLDYNSISSKKKKP